MVLFLTRSWKWQGCAIQDLWLTVFWFFNSADERFDATFHTNVLVNSSGHCQYLPPGKIHKYTNTRTWEYSFCNATRQYSTFFWVFSVRFYYQGDQSSPVTTHTVQSKVLFCISITVRTQAFVHWQKSIQAYKQKSPHDSVNLQTFSEREAWWDM